MTEAYQVFRSVKGVGMRNKCHRDAYLYFRMQNGATPMWSSSKRCKGKK